MVGIGSIFDVADNSGASKVGVIRVLGNSVRRKIKVGDILMVSVKLVTKGKSSGIDSSKVKVSEGSKSRALVVRLKSDYRKIEDGSEVYFGSNAVVLLNVSGQMIGTRVMGAIDRRIRDSHPEIASLAPEIV